MSTEKTSSKAPGQHLRRGKACLNCRFLKIKCDGVKPICGPCLRVPKDDECEYTDRPSRTQELQDRVSTLRARVLQLESQQFEPDSSSPIGPHPSSSWSSSLLLNDQVTFTDILEPPASIITLLSLDNFLPHAKQFGFFLDIERFKQGTLLPLPLGDPSRPSPALLYTVYLWATHLSPTYQSQVSAFLGRALRQLAVEVSSRVGHSQIIHTIQSQVLLATYFLKNNHLVEAGFHTNGAVSLALSHSLHKLGNQPPENDPIPLAEKVNAFWAVFFLDRTVKLTLGRESATFGFLDNPSESIDTPWPIEPDDHLLSTLTSSTGGPTILDFMANNGPGTNITNETSFLVQSMVLYYNASLLWNRWLRGGRPDQLPSFMMDCDTLNETLAHFQASLPPLQASDRNTYTSRRTQTLTRALTVAGTIRLNAIYTAYGNLQANGRCVLAAQWILETFGNTNLPDFSLVHPAVGALCLVACQTLINEIKRLGQSNDPVSSAEQARVRAVLVAGMSTMAILGGDSAMITFQLGQVQQVSNES